MREYQSVGQVQSENPEHQQAVGAEGQGCPSNTHHHHCDADHPLHLLGRCLKTRPQTCSQTPSTWRVFHSIIGEPAHLFPADVLVDVWRENRTCRQHAGVCWGHHGSSDRSDSNDGDVRGREVLQSQGHDEGLLPSHIWRRRSIQGLVPVCQVKFTCWFWSWKRWNFSWYSTIESSASLLIFVKRLQKLSGLLTRWNSDSPDQDGRNSQKGNQDGSPEAAYLSVSGRGCRQNPLVETLKSKTTETLQEQYQEDVMKNKNSWKTIVRVCTSCSFGLGVCVRSNIQLTIIRNSSIHFQTSSLFSVPSHGSWKVLLKAVSAMLTDTGLVSK